MAMQREVVVVSGVRTAIGDFGGGLKDVAPTDLGAQVVREALTRAGVAGQEVGQVVFGHVIHTEAKDMYFARVAARRTWHRACVGARAWVTQPCST
jgi:acetyl-CoA C-acetyltransferase